MSEYFVDYIERPSRHPEQHAPILDLIARPGEPAHDFVNPELGVALSGWTYQGVAETPTGRRAVWLRGSMYVTGKGKQRPDVSEVGLPSLKAALDACGATQYRYDPVGGRRSVFSRKR
jgi:hypothetical protein